METLLSLRVDRLPAVRKAMGIRQEDLAARLGVRREEVSRAEQMVLPGGLIEQMVNALLDAAGASEPARS